MTIGWPQALAVWWSAAWRGFLYGAIGGFILGATGGFIAAVMSAPDKAGIYGAIGGYLASIPASMLGLKQALSRHLPSLIAIGRDPNTQ
jgi:hypothetical protein